MDAVLRLSGCLCSGKSYFSGNDNGNGVDCRGWIGLGPQPGKEGGNMSNQHCPGFEANKSLSEVKIKCPACGKEWAIFSDELGKNAKCGDCGLVFDPKTALVK
jgi:rubredoxin